MDPPATSVPSAHQDAVQNAAPPPADSEKASEKVICSDADGTRPPSLKDVDAAVKTPAMRRKARVQFATLCWSIFVAGWNDGTIGPLLPRLQEVYHVSVWYYLAFRVMLIYMRSTGRICSRLAHFRGQLRGNVFTHDGIECVHLPAAAMPFDRASLQEHRRTCTSRIVLASERCVRRAMPPPTTTTHINRPTFVDGRVRYDNSDSYRYDVL